MKNSKEINNIFNELYGEYRVKFNVEVEFTSNVSLRKKDFFKDKEQCGDTILNGAMVMPDPPIGKYYILLDSKLLNQDLKFDLVESYTHELTHLNDYLLYSQKYTDGNYIKIPKSDYWLPFYFWSEYHAKWLGYMCMFRKLRDEMNEMEFNQILYSMIGMEINSNLLHYTNQLNYNGECTDYGRFLYELMRFIARISVIRGLKPEISLSDSLIEEYLPISSNNAFILEKYLREHNSYEKVMEHFDELREKINVSVLNIMHIE